jgi:hypothetical protein
VTRLGVTLQIHDLRSVGSAVTISEQHIGNTTFRSLVADFFATQVDIRLLNEDIKLGKEKLQELKVNWDNKIKAALGYLSNSGRSDNSELNELYKKLTKIFSGQSLKENTISNYKLSELDTIATKATKLLNSAQPYYDALLQNKDALNIARTTLQNLEKQDPNVREAYASNKQQTYIIPEGILHDYGDDYIKCMISGFRAWQEKNQISLIVASANLDEKGCRSFFKVPTIDDISPWEESFNPNCPIQPYEITEIFSNRGTKFINLPHNFFKDELEELEFCAWYRGMQASYYKGNFRELEDGNPTNNVTSLADEFLLKNSDSSEVKELLGTFKDPRSWRDFATNVAWIKNYGRETLLYDLLDKAFSRVGADIDFLDDLSQKQKDSICKFMELAVEVKLGSRTGYENRIQVTYTADDDFTLITPRTPNLKGTGSNVVSLIPAHNVRPPSEPSSSNTTSNMQPTLRVNSISVAVNPRNIVYNTLVLQLDNAKGNARTFVTPLLESLKTQDNITDPLTLQNRFNATVNEMLECVRSRRNPENPDVIASFAILANATNLTNVLQITNTTPSNLTEIDQVRLKFLIKRVIFSEDVNSLVSNICRNLTEDVEFAQIVSNSTFSDFARLMTAGKTIDFTKPLPADYMVSNIYCSMKLVVNELRGNAMSHPHIANVSNLIESYTNFPPIDDVTNRLYGIFARYSADARDELVTSLNECMEAIVEAMVPATIASFTNVQQPSALINSYNGDNPFLVALATKVFDTHLSPSGISFNSYLNDLQNITNRSGSNVLVIMKFRLYELPIENGERNVSLAVDQYLRNAFHTRETTLSSVTLPHFVRPITPEKLPNLAQTLNQWQSNLSIMRNPSFSLDQLKRFAFEYCHADIEKSNMQNYGRTLSYLKQQLEEKNTPAYLRKLYEHLLNIHIHSVNSHVRKLCDFNSNLRSTTNTLEINGKSYDVITLITESLVSGEITRDNIANQVKFRSIRPREIVIPTYIDTLSIKLTFERESYTAEKPDRDSKLQEFNSKVQSLLNLYQINSFSNSDMPSKNSFQKALSIVVNSGFNVVRDTHFFVNLTEKLQIIEDLLNLANPSEISFTDKLNNVADRLTGFCNTCDIACASTNEIITYLNNISSRAESWDDTVLVSNLEDIYQKLKIYAKDTIILLGYDANPIDTFIESDENSVATATETIKQANRSKGFGKRNN